MMTTIMTTTNSIELEVELSDQHVDFVEETPTSEMKSVQPPLQQSFPLMASEPISIPAMLCDEKLLEEIQSIPDKMGFRIGDVADILGIKQYVLRYWETEFEILRPKKASNNQRMYTRKDVENALLIRKLLHRDRFSIEGARNAMKELKAHVRKEKDMSQVIHKIDGMSERLDDLVSDIRAVRQLFR
jgi:DNA-binding transcriptional MerR regulator